MAIRAAELTVGFNADTKDLETGAKRAHGIMDGFIANTAAGLATNFFGSMIGGVKDVAVGAVMANAQFETMRNSLDVAANSAEKGASMFEQLREMAAKTPFEFPELMQTAQSLEALGVPAMQYMNLIGDTAAATGKSLDQVTQAMLDAMVGENERLKEFGIRAKVTGDEITYSWMTAQGMMSETVNKNDQEGIMKTLTGILGKYEGAMEVQSKTLNGMMSTFRDNVSMMMQDISLPIFEVVKQIVGMANTFFSVFGDMRKKGATIFDALMNGIRKALKSVLGPDNPLFQFAARFLHTIAKLKSAFEKGGWAGLGKKIFHMLAMGLENSWDAIVRWAQRSAIPGVLRWFESSAKWFAKAAAGWVDAARRGLVNKWHDLQQWVAFHGVPMVVDTVRKAAKFFTQTVPEWVANMRSGLAKAWPRLRNWVTQTAIPGLLNGFSTLKTKLVKAFQDHVPTPDELFQFTQNIGNNIRSALANLFGKASSGASGFSWKGVIQKIGAGLKAYAQMEVAVWGRVIAAIAGLISGLWPDDVDWAAVASKIGTGISDAVEAVTDWASGIWDKIKAKFEEMDIDVADLYGFGEAVGLKIGEAISWAVNTINWGDLIGKIAWGIITYARIFVTWWGAVGVVIAGLIAGAIKGLANVDWSAFAGELKNGLIEAMYQLVDFGKDIWAVIQSLIILATPVAKDIWEWVKGVGSNIVEGIKQGIIDKWEELTGFLEQKIRSLPVIGEKLLEINSPSKVFMRQGEGIVEGMQLGIGNRVKGLMDDVASMANDVIGVGAKSAGVSGRSAIPRSPGRLMLRADGGNRANVTHKNSNANVTLNVHGVNDPNAVASVVMDRIYGAMGAVATGMA